MGDNGYISVSGATARLRDLDVVANNLANVGTSGFKRGESVFRAVLEASLRNEAGVAQPGATQSAFVSTDHVGTDFSRGSLESTGSPLHAMIDGPGFFEVETANGSRYTRAGNFIVNREGQLAIPSGEPVIGGGGPIEITEGFARIESTGEVTDQEGNVIGALQVFRAEDPSALSREGLTLYRPADEGSMKPVDVVQLIPESIEGSNVEAARELATLLMLQRAFETNLTAMQVDDESTQRLIEGIR